MITEWCNLCNQRPAVGVLEVLDTETKITLKLDACEECVIKIPEDGTVEFEEFGERHD